MKILVTGAAGFIGSHAAERFKKAGFEIIGLDNFSDYYDVSLKELNARTLVEAGIPVHKIDLRNPSELKQLDTDFDLIVHFAAQPGIAATATFEQYFSNNILGTENLIEFAHSNKNLKHFINIATSSIYGLEATFPETEVPKPASWYGVTKLAAEQLVLSQSRLKAFKASSLRLYSVYGPRERPEKLYTKLIACGLKGQKFPMFEGSQEHLRSFTYVGDIVEGIFKAVQNHEKIDGEIINLGAETEHSTGEGIALVEEILGKEIEMENVPKRSGDQFKTLANIEKAKTILGYSPKTTLKEGLNKQVDWYKANFL